MSIWLWAYGDRLSGRAGESIGLHVAGTGGVCSIEIARVGAARTVVRRIEGVRIEARPVPDEAHVVGCGWPETCRIEIGADWTSGYYDIALRAGDGAEARHFVVVKASRPTAKAAIVLATNTYQAYNWWGGANSYVWVGGPSPARAPDTELPRVAATVLSARRPFSAGLLKPRSPTHRLVTQRRRDFMERPFIGEVADEVRAGGEGWDCPAGFLDKWEHPFVAWAEGAGYALDYLTDGDLENEPRALDGYTTALFVGHSEYWSWGQRAEVERFVDAGGGVAILSGNTCYWQCRWEDEGRRFVVYKGQSDRDPVTADPAQRHLASGLWSDPVTGKPEAALTGLSFLMGGYHRFANCVGRGIAGYTVWRDDHWALDGADLHWGDVFGDDCRLVGYENDGCHFTLGAERLPVALPHLGVPDALEIIATAPVTLAEPEGSVHRRLVPPEAWPMLTRVYAGADSPANRARMMRGHAVMASFRRGAGEVFNSGTTEWAYGLAAGNPFVDRITRNVLDRFAGRTS